MPYSYHKEFNRYKATNLKGQTQWFDKWEDADTFSNTGGPLTEYRGFNITPLFQISKNGKFFFTGWHQRCNNMEEAKTMIDMSIMAGEMMAKFPNLSKVSIPDFCELENGVEAANNFSSWTEQQSENDLYERSAS